MSDKLLLDSAQSKRSASSFEWDPTGQCVLETLPRNREMRGGANHSPTSSVLVKNEWSYTSTMPHNFTPCCGTPLPVYGTGLAII